MSGISDISVSDIAGMANSVNYLDLRKGKVRNMEHLKRVPPLDFDSIFVFPTKSSCIHFPISETTVHTYITVLSSKCQLTPSPSPSSKFIFLLFGPVVLLLLRLIAQDKQVFFSFSLACAVTPFLLPPPPLAYYTVVFLISFCPPLN